MSFDTFLKYFPPPKFLKPNRIGLSFSDSFLKMVEFSDESNHFPLKLTSEKIDLGTVISGRVIRADGFSQKINDLKSKLKSDFVSFTIPDELTYIYTTSITAPVGTKDIYDNVAFTLEENVPLPAKDLVFDFVPILVSKNGDMYNVDVVVFACLRSEIDSILNVLKQSFSKIYGCLPESQAITLSVVPKDDVDTNCVVYIVDSKMSIYFVKNRVVQFATFYNLTTKDLDAEIIEEYKKFFDYLNKQTKNSEKIVKNVFLCGDFTLIKQMVVKLESLSLHLGRVSLVNVWTNLFGIGEHTPKLSYENSLQFSGAIGSLLN